MNNLTCFLLAILCISFSSCDGEETSAFKIKEKSIYFECNPSEGDVLDVLLCEERTDREISALLSKVKGVILELVKLSPYRNYFYADYSVSINSEFNEGEIITDGPLIFMNRKTVEASEDIVEDLCCAFIFAKFVKSKKYSFEKSEDVKGYSIAIDKKILIEKCEGFNAVVQEIKSGVFLENYQ